LLRQHSGCFVKVYIVTAVCFRCAFRAKMVSQFRRFHRDETGALIIFTLMLFVLMLMMGGVAIDVMRYENIRTQLQNTLDRCTLMAAGLDQSLDPQSVVEDCVAKAGLTSSLDSVNVVQGFNSREVTTKGMSPTNPFFLHLIGIDRFDAKGIAGAMQRISNVELSLVLDVSGSMAGAKIANLKSAASEFVDTVLQQDVEGRMSIALVPYNGQVNLGATLRAKYTTTDNPNVTDVNCIDLPASVYNSTAMSRSTAMPMTGYVDSYSTTWQNTGFVSTTDGWAVPHALNRWCPPSAANIVRPPSNNITRLQANINGLSAIGATSINAGLKWGLTLLDPGSRGMMSELISQGAVASGFDGRPFDYTDPDALKIIVLMTDGSHFKEERLNAGYRTGASVIYKSNGDGNYSIYHAGHSGSKYWVPHRSAWQTTPWNSGAGYTNQTWQQVWAAQRVSYVAWQMYARALGADSNAMATIYTQTMNMFRSQTEVPTMDAQLQQICSLAKAQNVIIYGIAFEAPAEGQAQISKCASSPSHYFNAQGLEISTAFRAIANNITQLKLTQ